MAMSSSETVAVLDDSKYVMTDDRDFPMCVATYNKEQ
jgi:hypothetical protein